MVEFEFEVEEGEWVGRIGQEERDEEVSKE